MDTRTRQPMACRWWWPHGLKWRYGGVQATFCAVGLDIKRQPPRAPPDWVTGITRLVHIGSHHAGVAIDLRTTPATDRQSRIAMAVLTPK